MMNAGSEKDDDSTKKLLLPFHIWTSWDGAVGLRNCLAAIDSSVVRISPLPYVLYPLPQP
jgi:hypothetical protein